MTYNVKLFFIILSIMLISCDDSSSNTANNSSNNVNNNNCGDIGGSPYDYVMSEIHIPLNASEGVGVDLDGDNVIDNKLANLMQSLMSASPDFDMNGPLQDNLNSGTTVVLSRIVADQFASPGDSSVSGTIYEGNFTGDSTQNLFSGSEHFSIDTESLNQPTLCGMIYGAGIADLGPGNVTIILPIAEDHTIELILHYAQMKGMVSETGWTDMIIAGAVTPDDIKNKLLPEFIDEINKKIIDDPGNSQDLLDTFDNNCNPEIPGCESQTNCSSDGTITLEELQCNDTVNIILTPDVNIDGVDYVSLGVKVQAVSAVIDNL